MTRSLALAALLGTAGLTAGPALATEADAFPNRPVHIVVPYPAGGTADVLPRALSEHLSQRWGQPVVIENRTGAGGNIGTDHVAKAEPDGHTLVATPPGPLVVNQNLYSDLPFDPEALVPITTLAKAPNVLAVRNELPVATAEEFLEYARANPGKLTVATQGNGTTSHLTGAMYAREADTEFVFVPYRGTAPALAALVGGQVDVFFDNIGSMYSHHQAGNARILAVTTAERSPLLPDVPTVAEAGLDGFQAATWFGMAAPPNTPDAIADRINADVVEVLALPQIRETFEKQGVTPSGESRAEMAEFMAREREQWGAVIESANVTIN